MDIIIPIKEQVKRINNLKSNLHINSIITHIERAEIFFQKGKKDNDDQYFTDVVYRTNQAFEGCSRQAYMILAGKSEQQAQNIKAFQIEKFFIYEEILNDRVLPQFKNYRDNWRNESAHNFKLFFNEEEAYFALLNVSSYAYVLFNQMISKLVFEIEKEKLRTKEINLKKIKGRLKKTGLSLREKVIMLIEQFDKDNKIGITSSGKTSGEFISEIEIVGMLAAYFGEVSDNNLKVEIEKRLNIKKSFRADIFVEYQGEKLIIEIKRFLHHLNADSFIEQVSYYLDEIESVEGIVYSPTSTKKYIELKRNDFEFHRNERTYLVTMLNK